MNKIKFNDEEYEVLSYNKNTSLNNDVIISNASCTIITADSTSLVALMNGHITSIQIHHDEDLIYDLDEIQARITNISEYLEADRIVVNVNLDF